MGSESKVVITRLEPVHDPEAYQRAAHILGIGLRRALGRLCTAQAHAKTPAESECPADD